MHVGSWYETLFSQAFLTEMNKETRNTLLPACRLSKLVTLQREMAVRGAEWALLILPILKIAFSSSEETCKKLNVCSCELSNGTKIDLEPVDET